MNEYSLGLREAGDEELKSIIERSQPYLPLLFTVHSFLSVAIRLKFVDRNHTRIYLPVSEKLPFFIIITGVATKKNRNSLTPFWDPNEISIQNAKILLKSLPNWDWERPVFFDQASIPTLYAIKEIMLGKEGLSNDNLYLDVEEGYIYTLSSENIKCRRLNEEFFIARLREDYAAFILKHCEYTVDSEEGMQEYLKALPSMGAFIKVDSNENCEYDDLNLSEEINTINGQYNPASWTICRFPGEIGFSHTLPEFRNKGLCSAITLALAKELIKMKITPYVCIMGQKPASVKAHENIGFTKYCPIGFHIYLEKGMTWNDY